MAVTFNITATAQVHIKLAIKWRAKKSTAAEVRSKIKDVIADFKNQLITFPESGHQCQYLDIEHYKELIKDQYRFIYRVDTDAQNVKITIVTFCSTKMDYQTILKYVPELH
jgi:Txe/YoeB family toxin of Txe-Axe toxin-antitoxin module